MKLNALVLVGLFTAFVQPASAQVVEVGGHASYTRASGADGSWAGGWQVRVRFSGPINPKADFLHVTTGLGFRF